MHLPPPSFRNLILLSSHHATSSVNGGGVDEWEDYLITEYVSLLKNGSNFWMTDGIRGEWVEQLWQADNSLQLYVICQGYDWENRIACLFIIVKDHTELHKMLGLISSMHSEPETTVIHHKFIFRVWPDSCWGEGYTNYKINWGRYWLYQSKAE